MLDGALSSLEPVMPLGSLVYRQAVADQFDTAGQTDQFTIALDAGQTITVLSEALDASIDLSLEVRDPASATLATANAHGAGQAELLQTVATTTVGTYTILATSVAGTGEYQLSVYLNAALEAEQHGGPTNDTLATAQDLDASFIDLGGGAALASVLHTPPTVTAASEDFEGGELGPEWATYSASGNGRVEISTRADAIDGANLLEMSCADRYGEHSLNEAIWSLDLSGYTGAQLRFWQTPDWDNSEEFDGDFIGHYEADGVAISDDGVHWHPVRGVTQRSREWRYHIVDLAAEAAEAGVSLGASLQVKFQTYSSYEYGRRVWDAFEIAAAVAQDDWYSFTLSAGQAADVLLAGEYAENLSLELYDASGAPLGASVTSTQNADQVVGHLVASADATYYARVAGVSHGYRLTVARNAVFEAEPNEQPRDAQDITLQGVAVGRITAKVYVYDGQSNEIHQLDPVSGQIVHTLPSPVSSEGVYSAGLATTANSLLFAVSNVPLVYEVDPQSGEVLGTFARPSGAEAGAIAFLDGEIFILTNRENAIIKVIDYATGSVSRSLDLSQSYLSEGLAATTAEVLLRNGGQSLNIQTADTTNRGVLEGDYGYAGLGVAGAELISASARSVYVHDLDSLAFKRQFVLQGLTEIVAVGADGLAMAEDIFRVEVNAGDDLTITTATPLDGLGLNALDPRVELYDPQGQLAAEDDNGAPDGRNVLLTHPAAETGTYTVRVLPASGGGEYVLDVSGHTGTAAFHARATDPEGSETINYVPTEITVDFSWPVDPASVDASDLTFAGQAATDVTLVDGDTAVFQLAAMSDGTHAIEIAAGSILDLNGDPIEAFSLDLTLVIPPHVIDCSVQEGDVLPPGDLVVTVEFDEPLDAGVLDPTDVELYSPVFGYRLPDSLSLNAESTRVTATFTKVGQDEYTLTLFSAADGFVDPDGNLLDGEALTWPIPPNASGDGVSGGDFVVRHTVAEPSEFQALEPLGSLVFQSALSGAVSAPGEVFTRQIDLDAPQTLTVEIEPDASLQAVVEVLGPGDVLLASSSAAQAGDTLIVQTVAVATSGTHTVRVTGAGGTIGAFGGRLLLNAAVEDQPSADDSQSLDAAFVQAGGLERAAVLGTMAVDRYLSEDFESGALGPAWSVYTADDTATGSLEPVDGPQNVRVTDETAPYSGTYSLVLDASGGGTDWGVTEAIWTVDLAGLDQAYLEFAGWFGHQVIGDSLHDTDQYTGHRIGNGVSVSDDGENWLVVAGREPRSYCSGWQSYLVDLSAGAAQAGMSLGPGFQIKFQYFNFSNPQSAWDEISILTTPSTGDLYGFQAEAGDAVDVVVEHARAYTLHVELLDDTGQVLAIGDDESPMDSRRIRDFVVPQTGTYHVRVLGDPANDVDVPYTLLVLRDGALAEDARPLDHPLDIALAGAATGSVGATASSRHFEFDADSWSIIEEGPDTGAELNRFPWPSPRKGSVNSSNFRLAATSNRVFAVYSADIIYELNADTGQILREIPNPLDSYCYGLAIQGDELFAVTLGYPGKIVTVIEYPTGQIKRTYEYPALHVWTSGRRLLARLLGDDTWRVRYEINPHTGDLRALTGTPPYAGCFFFETGTYTVAVSAGDSLTITTATPGGGNGEPGNALDPLLELYDPSGALVAEDDDGAGDGPNARIEHEAAASGMYTIVVRSATGDRGEYVLSASGHTGARAAFRVVGTDIPDGARLDEAPRTVAVDFSHDVYLPSLDASDVSVAGTAAMSWTALDADTIEFELPAIGLGQYELTIPAGAVLDTAGRPVEAFTLTLVVPAHARTPAGSSIYTHATRGFLPQPGQVDTIPLQLDAGQLLSVVVQASMGLAPLCTLRAPDGAELATATGGASGQAALIQSVAIPASGTYTLTVTGSGGTTGGYSAQVLLNFAAEAESYGGAENDDISSAESLDAHFLPLAGEGKRAAVVGALSARQMVYQTSFEDGELGPEWTTDLGLGDLGRVRVTSGYGAVGGTYALWLDCSTQLYPGGGSVSTRAALCVDLSGMESATLAFSHTAESSHNSVDISDDGVMWHTVWVSSVADFGRWNRYYVNVAAEAQAAGMILGPDFRIRFHQAGRSPMPYDGGGWDDIAIGVFEGEDSYEVAADVGEVMAFALTAFNGDLPVQMDLLDASGQRIATGATDAKNVDQIIADFVAPATGNYYVRVTGAEGAEYSLVATRNAQFSAEPHDTFETAQDITATGVAMGVAGYDMGRLFAVTEGSTLVEIDPETGAILNSFSLGTGAIIGLATTPHSILASSAEDECIYEIDPDTGEIDRTISTEGLTLSGGLAFLPYEIVVRSSVTYLVDTGDHTYSQTDFFTVVLDYGTGAVKRTLPQTTGYMVGTPRGLISARRDPAYQMNSDDQFILVDPMTGDTKVLSGSPSNARNRSLAIIGDELFVSEGSGACVYDLDTYEYSRWLPFAASVSALAGDISFGRDWYSVAVNAGDMLDIQTHTPAGGPMEFGNVVDPVIELYDPAGGVVAVADNNATDGRNAQITHVAPEGGTYRIKVFATGLGGEYVLHVAGHTGGDARPFAVTSTDPADGAELAEVPTKMTLTFTDGVRLDTLDASDLKVDGVDAVGLSVVDGRTVVFALPSLADGAHVVTIDAGAVLDVQGTPIEALRSTFHIPVETTPIEPFGSLIYEQNITGAITAPGGVALYSLDLDANQTLTVIAAPDEALQPTIQVQDPSGAVLGAASATGPGQDAIAQTVPVATAGVYRITFAGAAATTGAFTARILLNAAIETEEHDAPANDDLASAQDLNASFLQLGNGGARAAVVGGVPGYREDFESARLSTNWETKESSAPRIRVTNMFGAPSGKYALVLDSMANGWMGYGAAIWSVDLSDVIDPQLIFWYADLGGDGDDPFTGGAWGDGIAISDDGTNWRPVSQAPDLVDWTWQEFAVDLVAEAQAAGISLESILYVKFQQVTAASANPASTTSDGGAWDDIRITSADGDDYFRFHLDEGDIAGLALATGTAEGQLRLLDPSGKVLTASIRGAIPHQEIIQSFVAPTGGDYYVRLMADGGASYSLVVTRNAAFDLERNSTPGDAQDLTLIGAALGDVGRGLGRLFVGSTDELYEIDPISGDVIGEPVGGYFGSYRSYQAVATTEWSVLIASEEGRPIREIDPDALEVIREIASPGADIRGMAFLNGEIFCATGMGDEILVLDYETGALKRTLSLDSLNTSALTASGDALYMLGYISNAHHLFQVDPISGQASDLGALPGASGYGLGIINDEIFVFTNYNSSSGYVSVYDLATLDHKRTLPGLIYSYGGIGADAGMVDDYYRVEASPGDVLTITTTTPAGGTGLFDNALDPIVELYDPSGALVAADDNSAPDGRDAEFTHVAASSGTYVVRVGAAAGTQGEYVLHVSGHTGTTGEPFTVTATDPADGTVLETRPTQLTMDFSEGVLLITLQASDLTVGGVAATGYTIVDGDTVVFDLPPLLAGVHTIEVPAGAATDLQGTPIEAFSATITVGEFPFPVPLAPVEPLGSLIYEGSVSGSIDPVGDTNTYSLDLDAGQVVTVVVEPEQTLQPAIELLDPSAQILALVTAAEPGRTAFLQTGSADQPGTYHVVVGGVGGSGGEFGLRVLLNVATEEERHGAGYNDEQASAQDLTGAFVDVTGPGDRAAVVGSLDWASWDSFESGDLGPAWSVYTSNDAGDIHVGSGWPHDGQFSLEMDESTSTFTLNEAVWTVNLTGLADPVLRFSLLLFDWGNVHPFDGPFVDHYEADGVAISADGVNWYPVFTPPNDVSDTWETYEIDLASAAAAAGIGLGDHFRIKFQQYGNGHISYDGCAWDDILVTAPEPLRDWYRFDLGPSQPVTVALAHLTGAGAELELYDASRTLVATGYATAANLSLVIENYAAPSTGGTYYVRVTGDHGTSYSLIITRGATFDLEPNDSLASAQDITGTRAGIGYVESVAGDHYSLSADAGDTLTITTAMPADGAGEFVNLLDPIIELYDPSGALVASDDNGGADGRNAELTHGAASSGTYVVRVLASAGTQGEYVLHVSGHTGTAGEPSAATWAGPAEGAEPAEVPATMGVPFTDEVRGDTLDASDARTTSDPPAQVVVDSLPPVAAGTVDAADVRIDSQPTAGSKPSALAASPPLASLCEPAGGGAPQPLGQTQGAAFEYLLPLAGVAFVSNNGGTIEADLAAQDFSFYLEGGQVVSAVATPADAAATLTIELLGDGGPVAAPAAGEAVVLQAEAIAATATYQVRVTSDAPTDFTLDVYRNTLIEATDTADLNELNLDAGRVEIGSGWYAVAGSSDPIVTVDEYTIDLTARVGHKVDVVLKGAPGSDMADARVDLMAPDGVSVAATSSADPLGSGAAAFDQAILGATVLSDGLYTLRVTGRTKGDYVLLMTEDLALDTEPNAATDPLRGLNGAHGALGLTGTPAGVATPDAAGDRYTMTLHAGQTVWLSTHTPFDDAAASPANDLDPSLAVYDPSGVQIAFDDDSAGDGKNAALSFDGAEAGVYVIEIAAESGGGTYLLTVDAVTGNTSPDGQEDLAETDEDAAVTVGNVLANDTDDDGDALVVLGFTQPAGGVAAYAGGAFTYAPHQDFNGSDSFTYTVGDGQGGTAVATVAITVHPVNDVPVAAAGGDEAIVDADGDGYAAAWMDASGSSDVEEALATYRWSENGREIASGTAPGMQVLLGVGRHWITLTVIDDEGAMAADEVVIDVTPPPHAGGPAVLANPVGAGVHERGRDYRLMLTGGENGATIWGFGPSGLHVIVADVPPGQTYCDFGVTGAAAGWHAFVAQSDDGGTMARSHSPGWMQLVEPSVVLYDGQAGTLPGEQGWLYGTVPLFGAVATQTLTAGGVVLDTTAAMSDSAGYFSQDFLTGAVKHPDMPTLDRLGGYAVQFTVRVDQETHANADRAGFSVIVLSEDGLGVELGFWTDEIWAQSGAAFTHAEGAAFDTTAALRPYELRVLGGHYSLWAQGSLILTGALRDYSAHPHPVYSQTSFLFLGDDTSAAAAQIDLARVAVTGW